MKCFKIVLILSLLSVQVAKAQDTTIGLAATMLDKFSDQLSLGNMNGWIFRPGNDSHWAQPGIDTAGWIKLKPAELSKKYADNNGRIEGWFRVKVKFDSSLLYKKLWIDFGPYAATELYIDGKLMATRGNTGDNGNHFSAYDGDRDPLSITFNSDTVHSFAVHYAGYLSPFPPHRLKSVSGDILTIVGPNPYIHSVKFRTVVYSFLNIWVAVCAALSLLFWLLVLQDRREKNLVWIALCTSIYTLLNFSIIKDNTIGLHYIPFYIYGEIGFVSISLLLFISIPLLLIRIFKRKLRSKLIIFLVTLLLVFFLRSFFDAPRMMTDIIFVVTILSTIGICLYYIISSWKGLQGAQWAIVVGLFFSLFSLCGGLIYSLITGDSNLYFVFWILSCFVLSFPLSLLVYVSMRFKEIIQEVSVNADKVVHLSEEKRLQAENQQKILHEEVNRQTAEIRQTLDNLKATQKQLIQSEKMASLGELTSGIAHEIQNPLNFVNNFSEVNTELIDELEQEVDKRNYEEVKAIAKDIKENERKINNHGKRAGDIVKGMLQHSRNSTGVKEPTDVNALADEYLRLSYHGFKAKDNSFDTKIPITIGTDFDNSIGKITIIPQDIGRVLLNLYNNAFYAVSEKAVRSPNSYQPIASVKTRKNYDKIEIEVTDNGSGIPQKIVDKIFQPFFTTKPTGQGTGLGLSLSYDIVKAHGGEIKVENKEGEGSTFIIELPIS